MWTCAIHCCLRVLADARGSAHVAAAATAFWAVRCGGAASNPRARELKNKKRNVNDSTSPGFHASASGRLLALLKEAQAGAGKDRLGLGQGLHLLLQGRLLHLAVCSVSLYQS